VANPGKNPLYNHIPERIFTAQIIQLCKAFGWRVAHFRPGMTKRGRWKTAMSGDIGFPDLVMARPPRLIFAELKSAKGRISPEQAIWLEYVGRCNVEKYEWRPAMINEIERILR